MKRKITALFLAALLAAALLSGCGASESAGGSADGNAAAVKFTASAPAMGKQASNAADYDYAPEEENGGSFTTGQSGGARADTFDKIIYSGDANVETVDFDETVERVYAMVEEYGGFLESSYVTGKDYYTQYYDRASYRNASFTIRVPRERFNDLSGSLESLGNVTYSSVQAQNITSQYNDSQSRLKTYRTEEGRLLAMLEKAETVEDMLSIEARLGDVRYNIEALTTTLTNWDSKINYATLHLSVNEVKELTQETPITRTFGDDLISGVKASWVWLVRAVKDFIIFLASALPLLILPAVVLAVALPLLRARKRKKAKKPAQSDMEDKN